MANFLLTSDTLVVTVNGVAYEVSTADSRFASIKAALKQGIPDEELVKLFKSEVLSALESVDMPEGLTLDSGIVFLDGVALSPVLGDYIQRLAREGFPVAPVITFARNLQQNPSFRAVKELFGFLAHGRIPLTDDGYFLAYKRIRGDYFDTHSGKVLNKPAELLTDEERASFPLAAGAVSVNLTDAGAVVVSMPRNAVDEDSNQTCSAGLHVCSFDYLAHFAGERVVACKVHPKDVVSIPVDYNFTKMRVCRYEIVRELPEMARDQLSETALDVPSDEDVFVVMARSGPNDKFTTVQEHHSLKQAIDHADAVSNLPDFAEATVINSRTGAVVYSTGDNEDLVTQFSDGMDDDDDYEPQHFVRVTRQRLDDGSMEVVRTKKVDAEADAMAEIRAQMSELVSDEDAVFGTGTFEIEVIICKADAQEWQILGDVELVASRRIKIEA